MKKIFEQIDKWLQEAKDDHSRSTFTGAECFHKGEVLAYIKVGVLLQRHLTSQCSGRDLSCVFEEAGELKCALTGKKVIVESRR